MAYLAAIHWPALLLFSALILVIALFALSLSGHFPVVRPGRDAQAYLTRALLVTCIIVIALVTATALGFALRLLPGPMAIIGAGTALLAAPQVLPMLPDRFVDGRRGMVVLAALAAALAWLSGRL